MLLTNERNGKNQVSIVQENNEILQGMIICANLIPLTCVQLPASCTMGCRQSLTLKKATSEAKFTGD